MKIGVLCPADIARRRFMPALLKTDEFEFVGVGMHTRDRAEDFLKEYPGTLFNSYEDVINSKNIECIYIPLPPSLHYKWTKKALENGKHVLVEKPCTTSVEETKELIEIARKNNVAIHENYMFVFHSQLEDINQIVAAGEIGDIRLYRVSFGFPKRLENDFRYNKALGGGALIDAGGYCLKYANMLLGNDANVICATSNYVNDYEVDIYGSATLKNHQGTTAQVSFGMDNNYKCELEIWGSLGTLKTGRVLTAPSGFIPKAVIEKNGICSEQELSEDDAFLKSIEYFARTINEEDIRHASYQNIIRQSELVEEFRQQSN